MRKFLFALLIICSGLSSVKTAPDSEIQLWPVTQPYETGYLKVSDIHEIYYQLCGNPEGQPVFALHGGPGGSCSPDMCRFFNPEKYFIVLHDQRGAGKSKPFADIRENTTQHLVADIERLRKHLKVEKMILFGGSWGSTLGLAYAEAYPEHVSGMVLRGIFLATQDEIDHFFHGGVKKYFPELWEKFESSFPDPERRPIPDYLLELLQSPDSTMQAKYARVWAEYEIKLASLHFPDDQMAPIFEHFNPLAFSRLENYYMANHCFLEEGQLLRDAGKIKDIPLVMVNGRYDMICPPITAYRLHKLLPKSRLVIAEEAGHWMGEKPIEAAMWQAMRDFEPK